jgi:3-dehydroquinate synthase
MAAMKRIHVAVPSHSYDICIGEGVLSSLDALLAPLAPTSVLIVTDGNVQPLYADAVLGQAGRLVRSQVCVLPPGERGKSIDAMQQVLHALFDLRADRKSLVVALGGGVVGDIAGFAAAVFMRGIRFVQIPTTLLAQVDSSVGGKTGVNHERGKNMIGAFHQPSLVVTDTATLCTLPPRELSAGLAEILKHGLLADARYFERTVQCLPQLRACESGALAEAVAGSCEIKAAVVARDERESGERALLNLGHTFGHAIEALTGYGTWLHGEAVGCGMCLAADLSAREGLLDGPAVERVAQAVEAAGLPVRIEGLTAADAIRAMQGDKKTEGGQIRFVLLERIGRAVQRTVAPASLSATLAAGGYV